MVHRLTLGEVDYNGSGRRNCRAELTWELTDDGRFSMQGGIWNPHGTDYYTCGQCVDTVADYFKGNAKVQRMRAIWERYHLNDMRAGCEHQRSVDTTRKVEVVKYKLTSEAYRTRERVRAHVTASALAGHTPILSATERALAELDTWYNDIAHPPDADSPLSGCYEVSKRETKAIGWVYSSEHPDGMLLRPCDVCGYRYGSAWLREDLPSEVVTEIRAWSAGD